ncbi:MAG: homoserine dehydrogenase [Ruminococcaceae bacterium]|nr:homoserine dehydrogenase [Oscillospiraceae bacterium]
MINVAILGFGVVGSGAAEVLSANAAVIEKNLGVAVSVKRILDLREFPDSPFGHLVTHDFQEILNDQDISVVAEMMGGSHPAYDFTKACLEAGKHVVTSNKEVVARFGAELLELAAKNGVRYLFEASVGGGIPVLRPMVNDLASNKIERVDGILNGTTNYILTRMIHAGATFEEALREAQQKGYAEQNPAADVEGLDAARKIVILAALSFGTLLSPDKIHCEGITALTLADVAVARRLSCSVKLIGHTELVDGRVLAMVSPRMVPLSHPLSGISDVFNGVLVDANMVGEVMFYGQGAGKLPTASAVVADIIDIVAHMNSDNVRAPKFTVADDGDYAEFGAYACRSCVSFVNEEGAAERIAAAFGAVETVVEGDRIAFISGEMTETEAEAAIAATGLALASRIRMLG